MSTVHIKDKIKIVFFDIDGTLVGVQHQSPPVSTLVALDELRKKGILICICTGRHILDVNVLDLPSFDAYITTNGAGCIVNGTSIYKQHIPEEDIEKLIAYMRTSHRFPCIIETVDNAYLNFSDRWVKQLQEELHIRKPLLLPFDEWAEKARSGVEQMLCFFGPEKDEDIIRNVLPGCAIKRWCHYFTDVIQKDCDKANGINMMLQHFNLQSEEAMAFGDGGNDISMLQYVGMGVAMGNASDKVKAVADYVTNNVEDDGIMNALKHFKIL